MLGAVGRREVTFRVVYDDIKDKFGKIVETYGLKYAGQKLKEIISESVQQYNSQFEEKT